MNGSSQRMPGADLMGMFLSYYPKGFLTQLRSEINKTEHFDFLKKSLEQLDLRIPLGVRTRPVGLGERIVGLGAPSRDPYSFGIVKASIPVIVNGHYFIGNYCIILDGRDSIELSYRGCHPLIEGVKSFVYKKYLNSVERKDLFGTVVFPGLSKDIRRHY
jgi:hypothetical protein